MSRIRSATAILALAAALGACVVGPNARTPPPPAVSRYTAAPMAAMTAATDSPAGPAQRLVFGADVPGRWWSVYHSPQLDALVDRALAANPDLKSAQAALRSARETYLAQRSAAWPSAEASYQLSRQQTPASLASILSSNADLFTLHTAQVSVSYAPDVFGLARRQTESAQAQAEAQRFQTEAVYLTLTSNVVVTAITWSGLKAQAEAAQAQIDATRAALAQMQRQFDAGELARGDIASQQAVVAQAEQAMPPLIKQMAQQRDLLADLTGQYPGAADLPIPTLSQLELPTDLPLSLPARLVEQRPDIRAADANLAAASAQVGVAIATRLPNFTLSAAVGGEGTNFSQLFNSANSFWTLTGGVTQPLFDAGELLHRQRAAEAALDQAKAQYQSTVLAAFQNVADTLEALQDDAVALQSAAGAQVAAAASLQVASRQFAAGEVGSLAVLSARQTYDQAQNAQIQAEVARLTDSAALYQALGGGWWNRSETVAVR